MYSIFGTYVHQLRGRFANFPGSIVILEETLTNLELEFITGLRYGAHCLNLHTFPLLVTKVINSQKILKVA